MIAFTLDLDRINKERIFVGRSGKRYLSFILIDAPDQYGNAGQVVQSVSREERMAGGKGEICGSWKILGGSKPQTKAPPPATKPAPWQDNPHAPGAPL